MVKECKIHPHVVQRHPELSEDDILSAWKNAIELAQRRSDEADFWVAVGADANGRLIEMVTVEDGRAMHIFHVMTPPSRKTLIELRLIEGK